MAQSRFSNNASIMLPSKNTVANLKLPTIPTLPFFQLFPIINCGGKPCDLSHAESLLVRILQFMWAAAGAVAVVVILWSAFQFITAGGDPGKAESAKKTIWAGLFGIIIIATAWAFTNVFARTLSGGPINVPFP